MIAGLVELPGLVFARWALVGTLLRTPALVLLDGDRGDTFVRWISRLVGSVWMADVVAAVVIVVLLRSVRATRSHALILADAPGS